MALRQMGDPVDIRAAIPNLKQRLGPNAYDDALRQRLQTVAGIGTQQNNFSAEQAFKKQQAAMAARLQELNNRPVPAAQGSYGGAQGAPTGNGKWRLPTSDKLGLGFGAAYS